MSGKDVDYSPLLQSVTSEDEDDVLESDKDYASRHNRSPGKQHDAIQLQDLGPTARRRMRTGVVMGNERNGRKKLIVAVVVSCVLVVAVSSAVVLIILNSEFNHGIVHDVQSAADGHWALVYNNTASESSVILVDVDGDGLDDVLVGVTHMDLYQLFHELQPGHSMKEICSALDLAYPCLSQVVALRGYDHKTLWRTSLRAGLIFINCEHIDVNGDSQPDCIFTGRKSSVQAVDLHTGHTHWVIDADDSAWSSHFVPDWTVFRAVSVPDVDGDGIKDVVVTHGGNQSKEPEDHDRASGRVIFLSGASGKPLGRYLDMPDSKETYMSPIHHVTANGSNYILLGSGGETIPGDLMIVHYTELLDYAIAKSSLSLRTLFRGGEKGVMVAPVLVDVTRDATPDILVSAFEGVLVLYDGETLQPLWRRQFPGMESYSTPAPGHYDEDGVLDFLILWGHGAWNDYDYATLYIISGRDGSTLWHTRSRTIQMNSDLSLTTKGSRDLFLFRTVGGHVASSEATDGFRPLSQSGHRTVRHIGGHEDVDDEDPGSLDGSLESFQRLCNMRQHDYEESQLTCSGNPDEMKLETWLMDEEDAGSPSMVTTASPQLHRYTLPLDESGRHCHKLSYSNKSLVDMCVVKTPLALTGAVGDVDGDGEADLIQLHMLVAITITDRHSYRSVEKDLVLTRISLAASLKGRPELLPMSEQPWRQFMGSAGDNVYRTTSVKG